MLLTAVYLSILSNQFIELLRSYCRWTPLHWGITFRACPCRRLAFSSRYYSLHFVVANYSAPLFCYRPEKNTRCCLSRTPTTLLLLIFHCAQDLDIVGTLGSGSFGYVQLVRHKRTGETYALKVLMIHLFSDWKIDVLPSLGFCSFTCSTLETLMKYATCTGH